MFFTHRLLVWVMFVVLVPWGVAFARQIESGSDSGDAPSNLNEHLEIFRPLLGKTYRAEFADSTPDKPIVDVVKYERAMNGQAIRSLHSINHGEYGGETIMMWDEKLQKIRFWYFTTQGFFTEGAFEIDGNKWTTVEKVTGNAGGVTEVRAVSELMNDGTLKVDSKYLQEGNWIQGHQATYKEAPDAKVKFK